MSREEVIAHLGTIARSGTREFFASLTGDQQKDAQLIGQFGVGFYSTLHRRRPGDRGDAPRRRAPRTPCAGSRDGSGEFTIEPADARRPRHRRDAAPASAGEDELLAPCDADSAILDASTRTTSPLPIRMRKEEWDKDKGEHVDAGRDETVNQASALWARPKAEITDEQYREFYKHVAHDFADAARVDAQPRRGHAASTPSCSTCRRRRPSTSGTASTGTASSCT